MSDWEETQPSLLDAATLRRLFRQLQETDIDELEVIHGSSRLYLRREPGQTAGSLAPDEAGVGGSTRGVPISAPLTGVYYSRADPSQDAYVTVGDIVEQGQVVALIETMKLFNEVVSELSGEVTAISVDDGDLVEAGQPLMYIAPGAQMEQT
jgi:acetyl-CoA carboxylase biotin carboxyl carrier protein